MTQYQENLNLCPTETKTLVPTENGLRQRIHIENNVLQMRETMFEKIDNVWACNVCKFSSHKNSHLREHVEKHIEGVEYPCNLCGKILRSSKSLRNHHSMKRCPFAKSNQWFSYSRSSASCFVPNACEGEVSSIQMKIWTICHKTGLSEMSIAPGMNNHLRSIDLFRSMNI